MLAVMERFPSTASASSILSPSLLAIVKTLISKPQGLRWNQLLLAVSALLIRLAASLTSLVERKIS